MRDKIINGMKNDEMRKSVIVKDKLTCEELIRICRSEDIINDQSTSLRNKEVKEINYVGNHKKKTQDTYPLQRQKMQILWESTRV